MIQAVLLFLLLIAILGIGGKWLRLPPKRRHPPVEAAARCPICRTYVIGRTPEPCDRGDCPYR
jgi:hypothetical protein